MLFYLLLTKIISFIHFPIDNFYSFSDLNRQIEYLNQLSNIKLYEIVKSSELMIYTLQVSKALKSKPT